MNETTCSLHNNIYKGSGMHDSLWSMEDHLRDDVIYRAPALNPGLGSNHNPVSSIYIWSEIFRSPSEAKYGGQWRP